MDAGCLVCVLHIINPTSCRKEAIMRKRKSYKWIASLLSAAILFTSEGMSCLAFAVPLEDTVLPPPPCKYSGVRK